MQDFDGSLDKVVYDFDGIEITAEEEAFADVEKKTLTFSVSNLEENGRLSSLARRTAKLQDYFPDHQIRINK